MEDKETLKAQRISELWNNIQWLNMQVIRIPEGEEINGGRMWCGGTI